MLRHRNTDIIHICYALTDRTGEYYKLTGMSICSVLDNVDNVKTSIIFHIICDDSLTREHQLELQRLVKYFGQNIIFYNIQKTKLWAEIEKIRAIASHELCEKWSMAMFYRLFAFGLFPVQVNRFIYLDNDILSNMDIAELWKFNCSNGIGAVLDLVVASDTDRVYDGFCERDLKSEKLIQCDKYFNSGVLLIERKAFITNFSMVYVHLKELFSNYVIRYPDQDYLNVLYADIYTELPYRFNTVVALERFFESGTDLEECLYHYAGGRLLRKERDDAFEALAIKYRKKTEQMMCDKL